ncbi:hypothetical protein [Paracoccus sp. S1E-3]|uniref:hypothetical protein n=2 Tax=Paracoccus TaxID=265 RepID=UPI0015EF7F2E|nr:hypothetical protein [Paracoccus sp. S1E-3]MBA4492648.1 hypothetical protein [Paracoccus sp. S1E-3]
MLTSVLPIPALAEAMADAVMLASPRDLDARLAGIVDGSVRMIHLSAAPERAPAPVHAPRRQPQQPPPRPAILIANSCDWADPPAATARLRAAVQGPLWLLEPATPDCDATAIAAAAERAAAMPERDRLALLLGKGLRLSAVEPAALPAGASLTASASAATTAPGAGSVPPGAAMSGKLIITALPAGTSLTGAPAAVIRAGEASVPPVRAAAPETAAPQGAATAPETAVIAPRAVPVSMRRRPGQPEPAIIVGELASLLGAANRGPLGIPREVRDRIRQIDIAFFEMMLNEGRFDPEGNQYAAAIQTELAQMNCYNGSVDGNWGNGSLAALQRYFSTLGQAQAGTAPGPELFRRIVTNESVRCPVEQRVSVPRNEAAPTRNNAGNAPRATGSRNTSARPSGTRATTSQTNSRPARTQPNAPAEQPRRAPSGAAPRINPDLVNSLGSGVIK